MSSNAYNKVVSNEERKLFQENGVVVLRNALTAEEIAELETGVQYNLSHPSPRAVVASHENDPGQFQEDFINWNRIPEYKKVLFESALPRLAAELLDSRQIRFYHDHLLVKQAGTCQKTPWHQDQPYYNIAGRQTVSFWIPIDPIPKESSLQFLAGSHRGTWYIPRTFLTAQAKWFPEGTLQEVPDINNDSPVLSWALQPGDVVAFHMLALHGSAGSVGQRRVLSARYMGDDVRHVIRPWNTSPPFDGLELDDGAEMDHPLFPVVYTRQESPY